jgi:hypothetical protein
MENADGGEEKIDSWILIDIKDHLRSYCTQFSENLNRMRAQVVEKGILLKFWNGSKEIQIWFDDETSKKLVSFVRGLEI